MRALALIAALITAPVHAATYYMATDGVDRGSCVADTPSHTWKSLQALAAACVQPGDTVLFHPGIYTDGENFTSRRLSINPVDSSTNPVTLAPYNPDNLIWPVKIQGEGFNVTTGGAMTLRGVEVHKLDSSTTDYAVLSIGIANVTVEDSFIHGKSTAYPDIIDNGPGRKADCIYIPNTAAGGGHVTISDTVIEDCSQDAIDIHVSNVLVDNVTIKRALQIQVKGGATNVEIRNSSLENTVNGITTGAMACSFGYCGADNLPTLPVSQRYNAKEVSIHNNTFTSIDHNWVVNFSGWDTVRVYDNTINQSAITYSQEVFSALDFRLQFHDAIAEAHCSERPQDCNTCTALPPSGFCAGVYLPPKNIQIYRNTITSGGSTLLRYFQNGYGEGGEICLFRSNTEPSGKLLYRRSFTTPPSTEDVAEARSAFYCETGTFAPPALASLEASGDPCRLEWDIDSPFAALIDGFRLDVAGAQTFKIARDKRSIRCDSLCRGGGSKAVTAATYHRAATSVATDPVSITCGD